MAYKRREMLAIAGEAGRVVRPVAPSRDLQIRWMNDE
jgi:hypothetical protein